MNKTEISTISALADLRDLFVARLTGLLTRSPVLPLLAKLQRTLDSLDIEGLDAHWKRFHLSQNPEGSTLPLGERECEPTLEEWDSFVTAYLARLAEQSEEDMREEVRLFTPEELRYHILAYLMSATFKDCSIILRLPSASYSSTSTPVEESVTAIDLDPKSVERLRKWMQLDHDIAVAYAKCHA